MVIPSSFQAEPPYAHGQPARTAILLCNLGTPDAPTPAALRRYLAEFLGDRRVVEIPRLIWLLILHGIILRVRPAKSAAKYASIWTEQGSPLRVWTQRQAEGLQEWMNTRNHNVRVLYAMRYGNPSVAEQLNALKAQGVTRVLVLPAYPQYSGTTSASVFDAVYAWASQVRAIPELRFINHYHDHPAYIEALAKRVEDDWAVHGQSEKLVMSFHGVPERTLHEGDPYHCECHKTARLLTQRLGLAADRYRVTFQSRFGKAKWLEPYTEPTLREMAQGGVKSVDVTCPGFTSDCLETLEEISMEGQETFLHAGGSEFRYIPCVNDMPEFIDALGQISLQHMGGWPTHHPGPQEHQADAQSRARALAQGAAN